jgi:hypothetical protein
LEVFMLYSVVVLAVLATMQPNPQFPSFSGAWVLDPSRSILVEGSSEDIELVVEERPTGIDVTQRTRRSKEKYSGALDGTPTEERKPSSLYVRTLRKQKEALVWQVKMTRLADQATISFTERWTLSPDGTVLTVLRSYPTRQVLRVFRRKK